MNGYGQIETIQLNLLLEEGQEFAWVKDYNIYFHSQIPGQMVLGQLEGGNEIIGLMHLDQIEQPLVLRGVKIKDSLTLIEWFDDDESGRIEIHQSGNQVSGYWYNMKRTVQIPISSSKQSPKSNSYFRQYKNDNGFFATQITPDNEIILPNEWVEEDDWNDRQMKNSCAIVESEGVKSTYCSADILPTYSIAEVDLKRIMWGEVPQIPHDETFNSAMTNQLNIWKSILFSKKETIEADNRWKDFHLIWFTPDLISSQYVSGMLSIQYYGAENLHSFSFIYDKKEKKFLDQSSFFRSNTPWVETFQIRARQIFEDQQADLYRLFPKATAQLQYHFSLTPNGLILSTDFNTYFGRMVYQLNRSDVELYLQRFAPNRENLYVD